MASRLLALVIVALLGAATYEFVFATMYYRSPATERSDAGTDPWIDRGFTVAVVWPPHTDVSLVEGVRLAADEVNAAGGLLAGKIHLAVFQETEDAGALARAIVKSRNVVAVIGHELQGTAIPASITYEEHGVLFLSPKSTDIRLTGHQFRFIFRLTPDDKAMAATLAEFASERLWKNVGVLHGRTDHGQLASAAFLATADRMGVTVPFVHSFFQQPAWNRQDYRLMLSHVRGSRYDALMLAGQLPWAAKLLLDMSTMGVGQPILATDKLDSIQVWQLANRAANNLYVASAVDPLSDVPAYVAFRERFRRRYNVDPGYGASQGYEAFMLFVHAAEASGSADPLVLATTLKTSAWHGLFGGFTFAGDGGIQGRALSVKRMQDGVFRTMETVTPEQWSAAPTTDTSAVAIHSADRQD